MKQSMDSFDIFASAISVSRETETKLRIYYELLAKWQIKINLVSQKTLPHIWQRHFLDSAQLFRLLSYPDKPIFDLGSGAGFPGLILSVMGVADISLLESDQRKCIFLSEVIRQTQITAKVFNQRIELFEPKEKASAITSRACASLDSLLKYAYPLLDAKGECLFLKGRGVKDEIDEAQKHWLFHVEHIPSLVDNNEGCILRIRGLQPVST